MAARRPFWKWHHWKSIGFCPWPPTTCIWNSKLKFQSKLELRSRNHVASRWTDRQTDSQKDKVIPLYPHTNFVGRGYKKSKGFYFITFLINTTRSSSTQWVSAKKIYNNSSALAMELRLSCTKPSNCNIKSVSIVLNQPHKIGYFRNEHPQPGI